MLEEAVWSRRGQMQAAVPAGESEVIASYQWRSKVLGGACAHLHWWAPTETKKYERYCLMLEGCAQVVTAGCATQPVRRIFHGVDI